MEQSEPFRYRPEIDGLRAVAVLGVVFFHAGFPLYGGYVGVDVFFVISGFLITSLILRAVQKGSFSLADFWVRRVRRILPASAATLVGVLVVGSLLLVPRDFDSLAKSAIFQCLFSGNIYFYRNLDYFQVEAELKPLLHVWSLAVEEQFYFIYPLILLGLSRFGKTKLFAILLGLATLSLAVCIVTTLESPDAAFFLLPYRAWELLAGGLLATFPAKFHLSRGSSETISWSGLLAIGYSMVSFNSGTLFPGPAALLPVLGAVLVIFANAQRLTSAGRLLAARPVVFVGLISYSWYLWHWPIMAFMRYALFEFETPQALLAIVFSFVIAVLSWRFVETPFRHSKSKVPKRRVFAVALLTSMSVLLIAALVAMNNGLPNRFTEEEKDFIASASIPMELETKVEKFECIEDLELPKLGTVNSADGKPAFLLWGDSHSFPATSALDILAEEYDVYGYAACRNATAPILGTWKNSTRHHAVSQNQAVLDYVARKKIPRVILVGRWTGNILPAHDGATAHLLVDEQTSVPTAEDAERVLRAGLIRTVQELHRLNADVWVMKQVPLQDSDVPKGIVVHAAWVPNSSPRISEAWYGASLESHKLRQRKTNRILAAVEGDATLIDPTEYCFATNSLSRIAGHGESYYFDDDHLSGAGAKRLLIEALRPIFLDESREYKGNLKKAKQLLEQG